MRKSESGGIIKGTLILSISTLVVKFLGLIFKIPIASYLGDEGMGYFNSAYTVFSFFYLICTAGVPKAIMILEGRNREGGAESIRRIKTALLFFGGFGFLCAVFLALFSAPLADFVGSSASKFTLLAVAPSVIFVALGEGVAIYGLLISILILFG